MNRIAVIAGLMLLLAGAEALAQTVYRCGPGGREYSQSPCPAGREVNVADPRSADQQRDGMATAARDAKLAKDLAAERREREREAAARGQGPAAIKPAGPAASGAKDKGEKKNDKKSKPKKSGKKTSSSSTTDGDFRATSPKQP